MAQASEHRGTEYTKGVADGTVTSAAEYVRICAARYDDLAYEKPIGPVEKVEEATDYTEEIAKLEGELRERNALTPEQATVIIEKQYEAELQAYRNTIQETEETVGRYQSMLDLIEAWDPPQRVSAVQLFAENELKTSISWNDLQLKEPEKPEPEQWLAYEKKELRRQLDDLRYRQKTSKEVQAKRNEWVEILFDNLPEGDIGPIIHRDEQAHPEAEAQAVASVYDRNLRNAFFDWLFDIKQMVPDALLYNSREIRDTLLKFVDLVEQDDEVKHTLSQVDLNAADLTPSSRFHYSVNQLEEVLDKIGQNRRLDATYDGDDPEFTGSNDVTIEKLHNDLYDIREQIKNRSIMDIILRCEGYAAIRSCLHDTCNLIFHDNVDDFSLEALDDLEHPLNTIVGMVFDVNVMDFIDHGDRELKAKVDKHFMTIPHSPPERFQRQSAEEPGQTQTM